MKRWGRTDFTTVLHFSKIYRSVPRKITIGLLYFLDVYDVDLWEKNLARSTAYSCQANVLYNFITLKKKQWTQMKTKQLKQDILNH